MGFREAHRLDTRGLCAALGMGIATSLYGVTVWAPSKVLPSQVGPLYEQLGTLSSLVHAVVLGLVAVVGSCLVRRGSACPSCRFPAVAASCTAFALWLLSLMPAGAQGLASGGGDAGLLPCAASLASGAAIALAMVVWAEAASCAGMPMPRLVSLAMAVTALVSAAMAFSGPGLLGVEVLLLLCLESVLLGSVPRRQHGQAGCCDPSTAELPSFGLRFKQAARALFAILVSAVVATFVAPVTNTVIMADVLQSAERYAMSTLSCGVAAAVFAVVWGLPKRTPSSLNVLLSYNVCLLALVPLELFFPVLAKPLLVFGSMGFFVTWFVTCEAAINTACEYAIPKPVVYGAAASVAMFARVLAEGVASALLGSSLHEESKVLVAIFLLVYLATCAVFLLYGVLSRRRLEPQDVAVPVCPDGTGPCESAGAGRGRDDAGVLSEGLGLSRREAEVLGLIMHGRNVPAIAEELSVSRNTVQTHVRHIYEQLGVHSRKELVCLVSAWQKNH